MKTSTRRHNNHDLYDDLAKIKAAFATASYDVRDKAGEMISESLGDLKQKSLAAKEEVATYTAERPFKSLGLAMLAGFIAGIFFRRSK